MRTTIDLDEELLTQVKEQAARTGRTMSAIVEDAVRQALARRSPGPRRPLELPTFGSGGVLPGVDLDNNAALQDIMDGID